MTDDALHDVVLAAERAGAPFAVAGSWGTASGVACRLAARRRRGAAESMAVNVLLAPPWPGLEDADAARRVDDALTVGLMRAGATVSRVRALDLVADAGPEGYVDAVTDLATGPGEAPVRALAGSWLAGTAAALASGRLPGLAFLVLASAPSAEVMTRRTPEDEDDPRWEQSPTLRLADALAAQSPLEAVTVHPRPVLVVNGAVDTVLPATHLESWRAGLDATVQRVDAVEVAFADAFLRAIGERGTIEDEPEWDPAVVAAEAIERWTRGVLSPAAPARRGR